MLFGNSLNEIDERLSSNLKKTKSVFPDEIQLIESGMLLMREVTQITDVASKEYPKAPNMYANHNLFARNRQLLLSAYISCLHASYGTSFVILRTVLENNNLIRLFNKNPQLAFDWLPKEEQLKFDQEIQKRYGASGKINETYNPIPVNNLVFDDKTKPEIGEELKKFYGQLCNYTHPNFTGWQELIAYKGDIGVIQNMPTFSPDTGETVIGVLLFSMILTFKAFVETFKGYLIGYANQLMQWSDNSIKIMMRYTKVE